MSKSYAPSAMEHESDCSSYSYCPDFKNFIDEEENKLFYIRLHPIEHNKNQIHHEQNDNLFRNEYKRMSLRRDKGILSKITGSKKKSMFDWKILNRHKYERELMVIIKL